MKKRSSPIPRLAVLGVLLPNSGCSGQTVDTVCNNPNLLWLWFLLPAVFGVVGGLVIYLNRIRQLKEWDLSSSPRAPKAQSLLVGAVAIAAVLFLFFLFFMLFAEACEPEQQSDNITFWGLGILLGTTITLGLLLLANRNYSKGSK